MQKFLFVIGWFFGVSVAVHGQSKEEKQVVAAIESLRKGIIEADRTLLESITADSLVYGHSNGKVQDKAAFIDEIMSAVPFDYIEVELSEQTIKLSGDVAVVRHIFSGKTKNIEGKEGNLKIGNTLVWQKQHGKWKLLARQAYKL